MNEPVLNPIDRDTACWQKLKKHLEGRLLTLRILNDKDMDERKRSRLGGTIADVKYMLSLDADTPVLPDESTLFKD